MSLQEIKAPISWFGGKHRMRNILLARIPPHTTYIEVFGGAASLLFAKMPAKRDIYNEINPTLVNLFRVLQNPDKRAELLYKLHWTPYAQQLKEECWDLRDAKGTDVEKAYRFFVYYLPQPTLW